MKVWIDIFCTLVVLVVIVGIFCDIRKARREARQSRSPSTDQRQE